VTGARFTELEYYYRPTGKPRHLQPWLGSVWRKTPPGTDKQSIMAK
jgi:hypothetical protein